MMKLFCVYRHIRLDSKTPFYVGKGLKGRPFEKIKRNIYWTRVVDSVGYEIQIVKSGLSEQEAFSLESLLIKAYKSVGYCECNLLTSDMKAGATWSDENRRKAASERWKRNNPIKSGNIPWNFGKKITNKDHLEKMRTSRLGKTFPKISEALRGVSRPQCGKIPTREESITRSITRGCKPFRAIKIDTNEVVWEGLLQTECVSFLNLTKSSKGNINSCLKGHRKYHKGYRFEYTK